MRAEGYKDDKFFVDTSEIESLIGAGARVIHLNSQDSEKNYTHLVEYKEHKFISATSELYAFQTR